MQQKSDDCCWVIANKHKVLAYRNFNINGWMRNLVYSRQFLQMINRMEKKTTLQNLLRVKCDIKFVRLLLNVNLASQHDKLSVPWKHFDDSGFLSKLFSAQSVLIKIHHTPFRLAA